MIEDPMLWELLERWRWGTSKDVSGFGFNPIPLRFDSIPLFAYLQNAKRQRHILSIFGGETSVDEFHQPF